MHFDDEVNDFAARNATSDAAGPPVSNLAQIVITVAVGIMCVWSTLGNLLTIVSISTRPYMATKCNMFILSLAFSDLFSGLIASPLWLYRRTWGFKSWEWGNAACKLFWFVDESTSYCTALHIASFAVWRFIGVRLPQSYEKIPRRYVKMWVSLLWGVSIIFGGFLFSRFYEVYDKPKTFGVYSHWPSCSIKICNNGLKKHLIYYTFSSTTFMLAPMLILFAVSLAIVRELICRAKHKCHKTKQKERRAVIQLALISMSFLIGYIPMTSYVMWTTRTEKKNAKFDYSFHVISYFLLRLSECFNPIIYNIACHNMRKASIGWINRILKAGNRVTLLWLYFSSVKSNHNGIKKKQQKFISSFRLRTFRQPVINQTTHSTVNTASTSSPAKQLVMASPNLARVDVKVLMKEFKNSNTV